MKLTFNFKYLCAFITVLVIEIMIALFLHDDFIRPYAGDILVVVLVYFFIKTFVGNEVKLLPLYIFIFAVLVEFGQYFHLTELLGLDDFKAARILFGSTFDKKDIICYLIGCLGLFLFERSFLCSARK